MKYYKTLWIFLFVLLAISSYFLLKGQISVLFDKNDMLKEPDFKITNIAVSDFNEQGVLSQEIIAPHLQHIADNKTYEITTPKLRLNNKDKTYWTLDSQKAHIDQVAETVVFEGSVKLLEYDLKDNLLRTIDTEKLIYYPKTKQAFSDSPVVYVASGIKLNAGGVQVDLIKKTVDLVKHTKIKYEPQKATMESKP